jgi:hypothetical protein
LNIKNKYDSKKFKKISLKNAIFKNYKMENLYFNIKIYFWYLFFYFRNNNNNFLKYFLLNKIFTKLLHNLISLIFCINFIYFYIILFIFILFYL